MPQNIKLLRKIKHCLYIGGSWFGSEESSSVFQADFLCVQELGKFEY